MSSNSIFALLNFPSSDPITDSLVEPLSTNVQSQMNLTPTLVNSWQQQDIAQNSTSGYFYNPAASGISVANTAALTVANVAGGNTVSGTTNTITSLISNTINVANSIITSTAAAFLYHTNRMSNVVDIGSDTTNPHYQTSISYGKVIMYIVNKTDNIQNNAPLIGSFGSIFAANAISANANTFLYYAQLYANTVTSSVFGNTTTYSSNISQVNAQAMSDSANAVNNMMNNYMTQDNNFYQNTKNVIAAFNTVSPLNKMGQTETDLVMNYIGTPKLTSRLSSQ
jgi:hypothetical protein